MFSGIPLFCYMKLTIKEGMLYGTWNFTVDGWRANPDHYLARAVLELVHRNILKQSF
jgi:hypothetical protein